MGDNLLRCSMVVDGIKETRTHMGSNVLKGVLLRVVSDCRF